MAQPMLQALLSHVRRSAGGGPAMHGSDANLLDRFLSDRDEAAFTALVRRHGGLVLAACRGVLHAPADVDDAFQATFLVLLRKASTIRNTPSLGGWLYRVASRVALRLRADAEKRRPREATQVPPEPVAPAAADPSWREVCAVLHSELDRLPVRFRLPLVLCYLGGKTRDEAAQQLGWSVGRVKGNLERGRKCLHGRLVRRGITLSAGLVASLTAPHALAVHDRLVTATLSTAVNASAALENGVAATSPAAMVANGVLQNMRTVHHLIVAVSLMALGAGGVGVGFWTRQVFAGKSADPPVVAQPQPAEKPEIAGGGRVLDPAGRTIRGTVRFQDEPVAGAAVRLITHAAGIGGPPVAPAATTDAGGRFSLTLASDPKVRWRKLVAREPHGRIGSLDISQVFEPAFQPPLRIDLLDVADASGRLTDAAGMPMRAAKIRAIYLTPSGDDGWSRYYDVERELGDGITAVSDEDGRFRLQGIPTGAQVTAQITTSGFGAPRLAWKQNVPCDLRLQKAGSIRVRFEGAADSAKLAGLKFSPARVPAPAESAYKIFDQTEIVATGQAVLTVTDIVPGRYTLQPHNDWRTPYLAEPSPEFDVPPGGIGGVVVKVSPAAEVRGRVIEKKTGAGVAMVSVGINAPAPRGAGRQTFATVEADADGRYRAFVTPGDLSVVAFSGLMTPGYVVMPDGGALPSAVVAAGAAHTFPDIVLEAATPVEGMVVDTAGRPVPGVAVYAAHDAPGSMPPSITDAAGRFRLSDLGADDVTVLRARTPTATTTGPVPVSTKQLNGPVKLVLADANACRLRGRVVDPDGKPIAGAAVGVDWRFRGVGRSAQYGFGGAGGMVETAADGRFETLALWPGDDYTALVRAPGFGKAEATRVRGVAGKVHDLGTITLPRVAGVVAGVVVDAAGQPIAGVRIFNEGDGPKPVATITGPDGRFRLTELYAGPIFVIARKDGHRFTATRAASGEENLRVTLLPAGAPPSAQPEPLPDAYVAARAKLVRHLLDRMWNLPRDTLGGYDRRVLEGMARVDLDQAQRWLSEWRQRGEPRTGESSALANALRIEAAKRAAGTDIDEAIGLLAPLGAGEAFRTLMDLSRRYRTVDPTRSLRFAEEAAVRARALKLPNRAWALADVGELVVSLDRRDSGRKLIFEAADLAQPMGTQAMQGFARGYVAARLVPFDLARAKALIPLDPVREANRWRAAMADRLAALDSEAALKLLAEFKPDNSFYPFYARSRIALRVAASGRTAEAVRLAEDISEPKHRTTALAEIAVVVAKTDPTLAQSLIDRAGDFLSDHPEEFSSWSSMYGGASGIAAWLAYQARLAGHPDVASVAARALACRLTTQNDSPERIAEMHAKAAMILALVDPVTAKAALDRAAPTGRPVPGDLRGRRDWLFAVALADPDRAIAEVDRLIAAASASPEGLQSTSLIELLITLTQPTEADMVRELNSWASLPGGRDDD